MNYRSDGRANGSKCMFYCQLRAERWEWLIEQRVLSAARSHPAKYRGSTIRPIFTRTGHWVSKCKNLSRAIAHASSWRRWTKRQRYWRCKKWHQQKCFTQSSTRVLQWRRLSARCQQRNCSYSRVLTPMQSAGAGGASGTVDELAAR